MTTSQEIIKANEPAGNFLNGGVNNIRQFRAEIDIKMCSAPTEQQEAFQAVSDEATRIIGWLVKLQESHRAACLKGSK